MYLFIFTEGRKHDAALLADSGLLTHQLQGSLSPLGHPMCLYSDRAYPLRVHLQAPFRNAVLAPQMQAFNQSMSTVCESVEWLFYDIISDFKFEDLKEKC